MAVFEIGKTKQLKEGLQIDLNDATQTEKAEIEEILKWKGDGFDLRTHIVHPRHGVVLKFQPYRRFCNGNEVIYFRRGDDGIERRFSESGALLDFQPPASQNNEIRVGNPEAKVKNDKRISS
jgi:hypothetical protein